MAGTYRGAPGALCSHYGHLFNTDCLNGIPCFNQARFNRCRGGDVFYVIAGGHQSPAILRVDAEVAGRNRRGGPGQGMVRAGHVGSPCGGGALSGFGEKKVEG